MTSTATATDAQQIIQRDRDLLIHPYLPAAVTERIVMREGDGCRLRDIEGREYLDATGGLWLAQIGHGRAELAEAAAEQMRRLEYFTSFWEFSNERAIELAERLVELSPASVNNVYYTSGGSEGNEAAIKIARYYHNRRGEHRAHVDPLPRARLPRARLRLGQRDRLPALPRRLRPDAPAACAI